MTDEQEKPFAVERAKTGRAKCKMCKCPIEKDTLRIAKLITNPFGDGKLKAWHHLTCLFQVFARQRATTKRIDDPETDIEGFERLTQEDQNTIAEKVEEFENSSPFGPSSKANQAATKKRTGTPRAKASTQDTKKPKMAAGPSSPDTSNLDASSSKNTNQTQDNLFREFRRVCMDVASVDAYTEKTAIVKRMLTKGTSGDGFKGDLKLWCKLLLPGIVQRVYNLRSKQLIKLFSRMLVQDEDEMLESLELGDVAETIREYFEKSVAIKPARKSFLTVHEVEQFLEKLSHLTKEEEQMQHFRSIMPRCTGNDLKMIIREIKRDLRINAGPKHILNAVHEDAYSAFQTSRDLNAVIDRCTGKSSTSSSPDRSSSSSISDLTASRIGLCLMTPVQPMLAEACKSVDMAMKKCPNGMLSEVKYDGERVQLHKRGTEFRYFSRSLKPVLPHKVKLFEQYIPQAFPGGDDLILDSEVLMIDRNTGQPLPFGTLGIHKEAQFKDANVCLFVFDCIYYNGEVLMNKPMLQRRKILEERMIQIPNRIMLSEVQEVHKPRDLAQMIANALKMGQEGLVLKDMTGVYEPGKRHWLKVKKDYLYGGAMADSADLVVLGAWYGTGNKGGMMSVFLMGCRDEKRDVWLTVCKVHTGHDDATLARLQDELDMVKIGKDPGRLPVWLRANKSMVPDFVAKDPKRQPVWEISGAEFTNQGVHTAEGISIRFPRVTRIREDKDWSTATSLAELRRLFEKSSESLDFSRLLAEHSNEQADESPKPGTLDFFVKKEPKDTGTLDFFVKKEPKDEIGDEPGPSVPKKEPEPETPCVKRKKKKPVGDAQTGNDGSSTIKTEVKEENSDKRKKRRRSGREDRNSLDTDTRKDENRGTKKKKAEYYAFIDNDYIEYTRDGSPVNWVECRKPARGLPAGARPLSSLTVDELNSRAVLKDVRATFADSFDWTRREEIWRTLRTLGAVVLEDQDRSRATHVIHPSNEIPSTRLQEFEDFPRAARHVDIGWVEKSAADSEYQDPERHAVEIAASYCNCPCKHQ